VKKSLRLCVKKLSVFASLREKKSLHLSGEKKLFTNITNQDKIKGKWFQKKKIFKYGFDKKKT